MGNNIIYLGLANLQRGGADVTAIGEVVAMPFRTVPDFFREGGGVSCRMCRCEWLGKHGSVLH